MGDERAARLRERREQTKPDEPDDPAEKPEQSEPSEPAKPDKPAEQDQANENGESDEQAESVKDVRPSVYMYVPEAQKQRMDDLFRKLKNDLYFEFDVEIEKNRDFYPLVIRHGVDGIEEADVEQVREWIEGIE